MSRRTGHYMPASLLGSQLATRTRSGVDEPGVTVPGTGSPEDVVDAVLTALVQERDVAVPPR